MADSSLKIVQGAALSAEQKKDLLHRLARVEGQLRGIQKLIASAASADECDKVAQQMAAARKALDRTFLNLLTGAMLTQAAHAAGAQEAADSVRHLADTLNKFA